MIRPRRSRSMAAAVALGSVLLGACGQTPSGVVAVVNGEQILESQLAEIIVNTRANLEQQGVTGREQLVALRTAQTRNLTGFIQVAILRQEAARRGIVVTAEEADELWEEQIAVFGGIEQLLARITELGWTEEFAREQVVVGRLAELVQEALRATIVVTDDDVRALYDLQAGQFQTRTVSHIQLATLEEANEVLAEVRAEVSRWDELAAGRSIDTNTAALGGLLGEQPRGTYPDEFDEAVWNGDVGSIIGPLTTNVGFHVVRIEAETLRTLEDVAEQLRDQIAGQRFQEQFGSFEAALFSDADVKVDGRFGAWDPTTGEVLTTDPFAAP